MTALWYVRSVKLHLGAGTLARCCVGLVLMLGCSADTALDRRPAQREAGAAIERLAERYVHRDGAGQQLDAADRRCERGARVARFHPGCPMGRATASPIIPTVWLMLEGSNSMNELLSREDTTRALRSAVVDPGGIIPELRAIVRFGLVLYSGPLRPYCNPMAKRDRACGCNLGDEDVCCTPGCGVDDMHEVRALGAEARRTHDASVAPPCMCGSWRPAPGAMSAG